MMNSVMTTACLGALLVGANAMSVFGEYGGYGDEMGMYGEYGDMFGAYGEDGYGGNDVMPSGPDADEEGPVDTCANGECEMGDDVDEPADEMVDFEDEEEDEVVPEPATTSTTTETATTGSPRTPQVNPAPPAGRPTAQTTNPTPPVSTPPTEPAPSVNTETTRATPAVEPAQENAAMALSGNSFLLALFALAAGGVMLM